MGTYEEKLLVSKEAVKILRKEEPRRVGLGSGTTMEVFVRELSRDPISRKINFVASSRAIRVIAKRLGLSVEDEEGFEPVDMTFDGADEVDDQLNLLKGGGGFLTRERILADSSEKYIILVDHTKVVRQLCTGKPLPVEVVRFGVLNTAKKISRLTNGRVTLRRRSEGVFVTENGNYILDVLLEPLNDPMETYNRLKLTSGVVEVGLFCHLADLVLIGEGKSVKSLSPTRSSPIERV